MSGFKPMLAGKFDPSKITFPMYVSPKLDGIRCVVYQGQALTRSLIRVPNHGVYNALANVHLEGMDGELIVGDPCAKDVYRVTNSGVMSHEGVPEFKFYVFDNFNLFGVFEKRLELIREAAASLPPFVQCLEQMLVTSMEEFLRMEDAYLQLGYEGIIGRSPDGKYKYGRSTAKEGWLIKKKNFEDGEARITGFKELMHNDNEATKDNLGRTKRSSEKAGKRASGVLGAFECEDLDTKIPFDLGSGIDDKTRAEVWNNQPDYMGVIVKYKSFKVGVKEAPRHPVFLGFRDPRDL